MHDYGNTCVPIFETSIINFFLHAAVDGTNVADWADTNGRVGKYADLVFVDRPK
jgi:hypothetical protein